jgi:hypothetical protein
MGPSGDEAAPAPSAGGATPPGPATSGGPAAAGTTSGPQGPRPGTSAAGPAATAPGLEDNKGLCQAYLAGKGAEQGRKLEATAFQALATAAGGEDKIAGYCAELLPGQAKPKDDRDGQTHPGDNGQGQGAAPPAGTGQDGHAQGASPPGR